MAWDETVGPRAAHELCGGVFFETVTLPKGQACEFVCSPSWSTSSIRFTVFIYCPYSHLLGRRPKQKLLFWQAGSCKGSVGFNCSGLLRLGTWQHVLAPQWFFFLPSLHFLLAHSLSLSLAPTLHTNSFSPTFYTSEWPNSQEGKLHQDQLLQTKPNGNPLTDMAHECNDSKPKQLN